MNKRKSSGNITMLHNDSNLEVFFFCRASCEISYLIPNIREMTIIREK